jgi:hypothetical protein
VWLQDDRWKEKKENKKQAAKTQQATMQKETEA